MVGVDLNSATVSDVDAAADDVEARIRTADPTGSVSTSARSTIDPPPSALTGVWNVTEIDGAPALDETMPTLEFGTDGILSGDASCNRFSTGYTIDGDAL